MIYRKSDGKYFKTMKNNTSNIICSRLGNENILF